MTNLDHFKLRAWHYKEKRMLEVAALEFSQIIKNRMVVVVLNEVGIGYHYIVGEEVDLIQCLGLPDRDGKLIYTGDIVVEWDVIEKEVIDFNGPLLVKFNRTGCGCVPTYGWSTCPKEIELNGARDESLIIPLIVGNKYENPELLK